MPENYLRQNLLSTTPKIKLGKRLQQIESMIGADYDHIWDCCCDHGLLGAALLAGQTSACVHFVDRVAELIEQVEIKLLKHYPYRATKGTEQRWQVHCRDASSLPLDNFKGRHLIIIAGVGGDLVTQLVSTIHQQHPAKHIDFLLCPVHHQFTLREQLIALNFSLLNETLIIENQRYYEILLVSNNPNASNRIHPAGSLIWQANSPEQAEINADYLRKTLAHYRRMQLNQGAEVKTIIDTYLTIQQSLTQV